jgi:hypothetical protein
MFRKLAFGATLALCSLFSNAALLGFNLNFENNGLITTEYQNGIAVREWLDLTVTNGIAYDSIINDLTDGVLANQQRSDYTFVYQEQLNSFLGLQEEYRNGWSTVTTTGIIALFNDFYGTANTGPTYHTFSTPNNILSQQFTELFGDTFSDGNIETGGYQDPSYIVKGTVGHSGILLDGGRYATPYSIDQPSTQVIRLDLYCTDCYVAPSWVDQGYGTWLAREVVPASAPATMALFTLTLVGLGLRRRLM